jgi:hypothetical protein
MSHFHSVRILQYETLDTKNMKIPILCARGKQLLTSVESGSTTGESLIDMKWSKKGATVVLATQRQVRTL